jgi:ABC-type uncharacterized transport system substrate-binding protein
MIMRIFVKTLTVALAVVLLTNVPVSAKNDKQFSVTPDTNKGKRWRIGYHEGGAYGDYQKVFIATMQALMAMGWIEKIEIPPQEGEQTKDLWNWLASNAKSKYIEFVKDAHYSANWDKKLRKSMNEEIIDRMNRKKDIDLIIAAGTWAGQDLANNRHKTPTIVISTSNPLSSGIIKSLEDSGYDHVHARMNPYRYERQVRIFHDIIGFKKLGIAYENSPSGRVYAALDKVEMIAKERGFEIVSCYSLDEVPDVKVSEKSVGKCFQQLGKKVDAIYVTIQNGVNKRSVPGLVKITNLDRIPTFAQSGSHEVKYGFLMSISKENLQPLGRFHAETIAKVLNGAKPRQLPQLFEGPVAIAINLKTAQIIGFDPPVDVLAVADEIYREIEKPQE